MNAQRKKLADEEERKQFRKGHKGLTIADLEAGR